jgi:hypothetical protein
MTDLALFHATMGPFLRGEISAEEVERRLGPSPSGTARLALYPRLVQRQARGLVDHFFRGLAAALEAASSTAFPRLRDAYLEARPPASWEPNANLAAFPAFVRDAPDVPAWAFEMADFAWARFVAIHAEHVAGEVGLERSVFVRHYSHDVVAASATNEGKGVGHRCVPPPTPRTVLFARHTTTGRFVVVTPSVGALFALLRAAGDELPPLPPVLTSAMLDDELAALRARGLLA